MCILTERGHVVNIYAHKNNKYTQGYNLLLTVTFFQFASLVIKKLFCPNDKQNCSVKRINIQVVN